MREPNATSTQQQLQNALSNAIPYVNAIGDHARRREAVQGIIEAMVPHDGGDERLPSSFVKAFYGDAKSLKAVISAIDVDMKKEANKARDEEAIQSMMASADKGDYTGFAKAFEGAGKSAAVKSAALSVLDARKSELNKTLQELKNDKAGRLTSEGAEVQNQKRSKCEAEIERLESIKRDNTTMVGRMKACWYKITKTPEKERPPAIKDALDKEKTIWEHLNAAVCARRTEAAVENVQSKKQDIKTGKEKMKEAFLKSTNRSRGMLGELPLTHVPKEAQERVGARYHDLHPHAKTDLQSARDGIAKAEKTADKEAMTRRSQRLAKALTRRPELVKNSEAVRTAVAKMANAPVKGGLLRS